MMSGYVLVFDNEGHWYVIPDEKRKDWSAFCGLDPEDEESWVVPDYAEAVGGAPSLVVFDDYKVR